MIEFALICHHCGKENTYTSEEIAPGYNQLTTVQEGYQACNTCNELMPVWQMRIGAFGKLICGTEPGSELALQCTSRMLARKDKL